MSKRKRSPDDFVPMALCDEREARVFDKLTVIEKKVDSIINEKKEESHAVRDAILSVAAGIVIAVATWAISHVHF